MKEVSDFGNRLKEQRKKLGLTQTEIAEKCGISARMWGDYERGKYFPRNENLLAIEQAGIDMNYVQHGNRVQVDETANIAALTPAHNVLSQEEQELLDIFRQLESSDRHALKRQAQMLLAIAQQEKKETEVAVGQIAA